MHELSVCQALIDQVEAIAAEHRAREINEIFIEIGPLSGVEPPLLEQAFDIASAGTVADGAKLIVRTMPVRVSCRECGAITDALPSRLVCGVCGDWRTQLVSGDELLLTSLEFTRDDDDQTCSRGIAREIDAER
ncbi:MAG: hydrogenase maturation nickel metallochaperone HypA [Pseudomonadota bacterium]